jgi:hypothetical protein
MNKEYFVRVVIEYAMNVTANSESEAVEQVKSIFEQDHNIELSDKEIVEVKLEKEGN